MRPLLPALTATVLVGASGVAAAAQPLEQLVILLRPPQVDELTREALARISGELSAARFRVIIFPLETGGDPIDQVETVGRDFEPVAAFALVRGTSQGAANMELWISDRLAQRTTIQRMRVQDGDVSRAAEVLAVESVELIRISMADLWPRPALPPPAALVVEAPPESSPQAEAALAVGVGLQQALGTSTPSWAPAATLSYGRAGGLSVFLSVRGLGPNLDLVEADGAARVRRDAAWLGLAHTFRPGRRLQPLLSLAGGAEYLRAEGTAPDAARAHVRTSWSGVVVAGAGLVVTIVPHVALVLDVSGVGRWPQAAVRIGSSDVQVNRPSLLVEGGLRASF
jgi:hypothetical protein